MVTPVLIATAPNVQPRCMCFRSCKQSIMTCVARCWSQRVNLVSEATCCETRYRQRRCFTEASYIVSSTHTHTHARARALYWQSIDAKSFQRVRISDGQV